jgi:hypothetical protein
MTETGEAEAAEVFEEPGGDPLLHLLAETAARVGVPLEIALVNDGVLVSGRLIDELTYLSRLADHLQRVQEAKSEQAAKRHDLAALLRDQIRGFQPGAVLGSEYIHLEEATISRDAGDVLHVELWRGTAEDVAGWSVG